MEMEIEGVRRVLRNPGTPGARVGLVRVEYSSANDSWWLRWGNLPGLLIT